jgi:sigma-B regulation protein RsbU (phosphoserine phosphatase)
LEKEFLEDYGDRSAKIVQAGLLLGALVFILVGFYLDNKFFPIDPEILLPWRIAGASVMLTSVVLLGFKSLRKHFQLIVIVGLTLVSVTIMKTALTYYEGGLYNSSVAITAFIIFIHTLSRIRFIYTTVITWIFIGIYVVLVQSINLPDIVITQSVSFFIVINLFLMSASYWIEFSIRDAFVKSKQLQISSKELEAEHKRTSDELASVKELQVSLLPDKTPSFKNIDVGFYMCTATEVGGDYCDYVNGYDDALSFAIGDATGHGARASTMVMATKMLFNEYATRKTVSGFMRHASATIKNLNLPKLYMAFAFGRISGNKLEISGAGIPPAILYKSQTNSFQHIVLKGLPLGTFVLSDYEEKEYLLEANDILLLMTDGVTELQNSAGEMYELKHIENQIKENSHLTANELVKELFKLAHIWRGDEPFRDDMTMLALKIKN